MAFIGNPTERGVMYCQISQCFAPWRCPTAAGPEVEAALVQLVELWQVRQPTVSQTLQQLIEGGAVGVLGHDNALIGKIRITEH